MSLAAAMHPGEFASKPGTACAACGLPARHRITVKAPHWTFPEDRDVCDECRRTFLAQVGDTKKPSTLITKITHQPAEVPPVPAPAPSVGSPPPSVNLCRVPGCGRPARDRGLCGKDVQAFRTHGKHAEYVLPPKPRNAPKKKAAPTPKAAPMPEAPPKTVTPDMLVGARQEPITTKPSKRKARPANSAKAPRNTPPIPSAAPSSSARITVRLGAMVVELAQVEDVVALYRAMGGER